jgi:translocation and assembly module TamB
MVARTLSRTLRLTAGLLLSAAILFVIAFAVVQTEPAKRQLARLISRLASSPGRLSVEMRGLAGTIPTRFSIAEISISDAEGMWLHVTGIEAHGSPSDLMRGRIHLRRVAAATVDLARLPRLPEDEDDEPFEAPRVLRTLAVDELHVNAVRLGRELWTEHGEARSAAATAAAEWSSPVIADVSGAYRLHEETLTARLTLSSGQSSGLLPRSIALRTRDLRLTGAVEGYFLRPKGALTLTARAPAYGEDIAAGALEVQVRGAPASGDGREGPYDVSVETTLRDARVSEVIDSMLGPEVHLALQARIDPGAERIQVGSIELQAAALAAHTSADVEDGDVTVPRLEVDVRDLSKLGGKAGGVITGGALALEARGEAGTTSGEANGTATGRGSAITVSDPRLQRLIGEGLDLSGSFAIERDDDTVRLSDLHMTTAHADVHGEAVIRGTPAVLEAKLAMNVADLDPVTEAAVAGGVQAEATVRGPLDALVLEATARSEQLRVRHGPAFSGTMSVNAINVKDAPNGTLRADLSSAYGPIGAGAAFALVPGQSLSLSNVAIDATGAKVAAMAVVELPSGITTGTVTGKFTDLSGLSPLAGGRLEGTGDLDARFFPENGEQRTELTARVKTLSYRGLRGLNVKQAKLEASLRGISRRAGGEAHLTAKEIRVADASITTLTADAGGAAGKWDLDVHAQGRYLQHFEVASTSTIELAQPPLRARIRSLEGSLGERLFGLEQEAVITRADDALKIENFALTLGDARARAAFDVARERLNGTLEVDAFPLDLLQLYNPTIDLRGTADGRLTATGTRQRPELRFVVDAKSVEVGAPGHAEIPAVDVHSEGSWDARGLAADATLTSGEATRFDLHAKVPPGNGGVSIELDGTANIALLAGLWVLGEDRVAGTMQTKLLLTGTMESPRITGDVLVNDGYYENAALGSVLEHANVHLVGEGTRLTLERFDATDGAKGRISATGGVDFAAGLKDASYGLDVTLESARVARRDELSGRASGTLRIAGAGAAPLVAGKITTERGNIRIPDRLPPDVVELEVVEKNVAAARDERYALPEPPNTIPAQLDLEIHMPDHIFVRGSEVDTEWGGDLRVTGTARDPIVEGKLTLVRGTFNIVNVRMKAVEGTIAFDGGNKIDPTLNVVGEAKKRDIVARVTITGRATKPEIAFTSDPPMPQDEVLARLMFGKEPGQLSAVESVQLAAAVARLSGKGGRGTDPFGWLQRTFKVDTVGIASDDTTDGSVLSVGKYVSDKVFVSINQGLGENSSSAAVEVEVRRNVTLQTRIGNVEGRLGINWKHDY